MKYRKEDTETTVETSDADGLPSALASYLRNINPYELFTWREEREHSQNLDVAKYPAYLALWLLGCRYIPREYRGFVHTHTPRLVGYLPPAEAQADSHPDPLSLQDIYAAVTAIQLPTTELQLGATQRKHQAGQRQIDFPTVFSGMTPKGCLQLLGEVQPTVKRYHMLRNRFALHNMRLVVSLAAKFNRSDSFMMDYIQEGNKGLLRAIDRFDHYKALKFSTYATWWVRQQISRYITEHNSTIRVPAHIQELHKKILRFVEEHQTAHGNPPTKEVIAKHFPPLTPAKVVNILYLHPSVSSMNQPIGETSDTEMGDSLVDHNAVAPDHHATVSTMQKKLVEVMETLTPREKNILVKRFGIGDGQALTLQEVGRIFSITRERVRQIEAKALKKMRHPQRLRFLRGDPKLF